MYIPVPVVAGCLVLVVLADAPTAGAQQLDGPGQQATLSKIDQIVAYSSSYAGEEPIAGFDGDSSGNRNSGDLCVNPDGYCGDIQGDLPLLAGGANEAVVWQGMLGAPCTDCIVDLLQYGNANSIRIEQDGAGNALSALQDGDSNQLLGLQSGANNFIGISQYNADNFADIIQYGDDHSIAVTQPGNGFIVITQE